MSALQGDLRYVKGNLKEKDEIQVYDYFMKEWQLLNAVVY